MPTTGDTWIALATGQILDFAALDEDLVARTREGLAELRADIYGQDATIGASLATFTYAASTLSLVADRFGVTPDGYRIAADNADAAWIDIPFEDTAAVIYHIGARRQIRPSRVTGNTADGGFYYDLEIEDVGEMGAPDLVTNRGAGAGLYLDVDGLVAQGWTVADTRPVVVWLVNPVTGGADAIYEGVVAWDAGAGVHRITVPHYFGQDPAAPSLTEADYVVIVRGPTITTTPLGSNPNYWYLGACNTGVPATTGQNLNPTWGSWLALFGVEHNTATGAHTQINANGVNLTGGLAGSQLRQVFTPQELGAYLGEMEMNGGGLQAALYVPATAGDPSRIETTGAVSGTFAFLDVPARLPHDQGFTILGMDIALWLRTAGAGEDFAVELVRRTDLATGVGVGTVVGSWTASKPAAATWSRRTTWGGSGFPFVVAAAPANESYWWRLKFHENNPNDTRIGHLTVRSQATRIEPWR